MATRCAIGYSLEDGTIIGKYSHYDGYPEHTGAMLVEHYTDFDLKIKAMIALGDQSYLAPEIFPEGDTHSFDTPEKDVTVFYGRDRGETGTEPLTFEGYDEFLEHYKGMGCEYFYHYNSLTKTWYCYDLYRDVNIDLYMMEEEAA